MKMQLCLERDGILTKQLANVIPVTVPLVPSPPDLHQSCFQNVNSPWAEGNAKQRSSKCMASARRCCQLPRMQQSGQWCVQPVVPELTWGAVLAVLV